MSEGEGDLKTGDAVVAKWPGSRRFLAATIVKQKETGYSVKFADGSLHNVAMKDVQWPDAKSPKSKKSQSPTKPWAESPSKSRAKSPSKSRAKSPSKPRSKSRSKGRSPSKSPSRIRDDSPGRKDARSPSRSPARTKKAIERDDSTDEDWSEKPKKPARTQTPKKTVRSKSPSKKVGRPRSLSKTREEVKVKASPKTPPTTPKKRQGRPAKSLVEMSPDTSPEISRKMGSATRGRPRGTSGKDQIPNHGKNALELIPLLKKIESKAQAMEEEDKVIHKIYSTRSQSLMKIQPLALNEKLTVAEPTHKWKPGILGIVSSTLAIILLPVFTVFLALATQRKHVSLLSIPQVPKKPSTYFSYESAGVYLGFVLLQIILAAFPFGRVVKGFQGIDGKAALRYRLNGIYALLVSVALLGVAIYLRQPVYFVHDNFFKLTFIATGFSVLLSVGLYIRALYRPASQISQFGSTGCTPYDFFRGREVNPRIGALFDLKLLLVRIGLVGGVVVGGCLLYKAYLLNGSISYEQAAVAFAQGLYILNLLYREEVLLATATFMHEGVGFGFILSNCAGTPFMATIPLYYLVHFKPVMPLYCLGGILAVYALGLVMHSNSLSLKYAVERNPEDSSLAGLSTIRSPDMKPLLASNWWGLIRHPNYTADILMFLAWTLPCGFHSPVPYVYVLFFFLARIRRCFQVDAIMALRYKDAFTQYKHQVPYRLCPKIF